MREVGAYCIFFMQIYNLPCINTLNRDVGKQQVYGMSVVNNPLKFMNLAIRFLAETFMLFMVLPNYNLESHLNIHN